MLDSKETEKARKQWKEMTPKEFWKNYWFYYKIHTFAGIFALFLIIMLIRDAVTNNQDTVFQAMLINWDGVTEELDYGEVFSDDFAAYLDLDPNKEIVQIDCSVYLDFDDSDQVTVANSQRIMAMTSTGELDVMIGHGRTFNYYVEGSYFVDLTTALPEDLLEKLKDNFYYVPSEDGELIPIAIMIRDFPGLQERQAYQTVTPYLGIVLGTPHIDYTIAFIRYLMGE